MKDFCGIFDPEGLFQQPDDKRLEKVLMAMAQGAYRTADLSHKYVSGSKGTVISAKVTKSARVVMGVYQHTPPGGAKMPPVLIPLGVFDSHDAYVQCLKHHAKAKLARHIDQFSIDQVQFFKDMFPASDQAPVEDAVQLAQLVFYGNVEVIEFTDLQSEALKLKCPALLEGPAGSGKTLVLFQLLQQVVDKLEQVDGEVLPVLYVAPEHLAKEAKKKWQELGIQTRVTVLFKAAEDIAKEQYPGANVVGFEAFETWFADSAFARQPGNNQGKKGAKAKKSKAKKIDVEALYRELKLIAAVGPNKYMQLGVRNSRFAKDMREQAVKVFKSYQRTLLIDGDAEKKVDPYLCPSELPDHASYSYTFIDEAQNYPACQYPPILKEADGNVIAAMDSNQVTRDAFTSSRMLHEMFDAHAIKFHRAFLTGTHRVPIKVSQAAENLLRLKNLLLGGVTDQGQSIKFPSYVGTQGEMRWYRSIDDCGEQFARWQNSANVAFIAPNKDIQEVLEDKFGFPQVFLIDEIIGLEYEEIIAVGSDVEFMKIVRERGLSPDDKHTSHQTKDKKAVISHEAPVLAMNRLFVAMTRAQDTFCFVSSMDGKHDERNVEGLHEWLLHGDTVKTDNKPTGSAPAENVHSDEQLGGAPAPAPRDKEVASSTPEEWFEKAVELIKKKAFRQAERIYRKHRNTMPFKPYRSFAILKNAVDDDKLRTFEESILADLEAGDFNSLHELLLTSVKNIESICYVNKLNRDSSLSLMESIVHSQKAVRTFFALLRAIQDSTVKKPPLMLDFIHQLNKHLSANFKESLFEKFLQKKFTNEDHVVEMGVEIDAPGEARQAEKPVNPRTITNESCYLFDLIKGDLSSTVKALENLGEDSVEHLAQIAPLFSLFGILYEFFKKSEEGHDEQAKTAWERIKYLWNRFLADLDESGEHFFEAVFTRKDRARLFAKFLSKLSIIPQYFRSVLFNILYIRKKNLIGQMEWQPTSFLQTLCITKYGINVLFSLISDHPELLNGDPLPWHQRFEGKLGKDSHTALEMLQDAASSSGSAAKLLSMPGFKKILAYKPPEGLEENDKKSTFLNHKNPPKDYFVKLMWNKKRGVFKLDVLFDQPFVYQGVIYHCLYDAIADRMPHKKIFLEVVYEIVFEGKHILFEKDARPLKDFIEALIKAMSINDFYILFIEPVVSSRYGMIQMYQNPHGTMVHHVFMVLKYHKELANEIDLSSIVDELGEEMIDDIFSRLDEHEHHFRQPNSLLNSPQEDEASSSDPIAGSGETPDEQFPADSILADLMAGDTDALNGVLLLEPEHLEKICFIDKLNSDPSSSLMEAVANSRKALMSFFSLLSYIQASGDQRRALVLALANQINQHLSAGAIGNMLEIFFMKDVIDEDKRVVSNKFCYLLDLIKLPVPEAKTIEERDQKSPLLHLFFLRLFLGKKGGKEKSRKVQQALKFDLNRFLIETDENGRHLFSYIYSSVPTFNLFSDFLSDFFQYLLIPQYFKSVLFGTLHIKKKTPEGEIVFTTSSLLKLMTAGKIGARILSILMTGYPDLFNGDHLAWYQRTGDLSEEELTTPLELSLEASSEYKEDLLKHPLFSNEIQTFELPKNLKSSKNKSAFLDHERPAKDYFVKLLWDEKQGVFKLDLLFHQPFVHRGVIYRCLYHAIAERMPHRKTFLEVVFEIIFKGKHILFTESAEPLKAFLQELIYSMNLIDFYAAFVEPVIYGRYSVQAMHENPHHTIVVYIYFFIKNHEKYKKNIDLSPLGEEHGEKLDRLYEVFHRHEEESPRPNSLFKNSHADRANDSAVDGGIDTAAMRAMLGAGAPGPQPKSIEGLDTPTNKLSILRDLNEGGTDSLRLLCEKGTAIVEQVLFKSKMSVGSKQASLMETILSPENRRAAFTLFSFLSEVQYINQPRDPRAINLAVVLRRFSDWIINHLSLQDQATILFLFMTPTFNLEYSPCETLREYSTETPACGLKTTDGDSEFYLLELAGQHFHPLKRRYKIPNEMLQMFVDIFVSSNKSNNKVMKSMLRVQLNRFLNEVSNLGRNFLYLIFANVDLNHQFNSFLLAMHDGWLIDAYFKNALFQTLFGNDCVDGVDTAVVTSLLNGLCAGVNETLEDNGLSFLYALIRKYPGLLKGPPLPWHQGFRSSGQCPLAVLGSKAEAGDVSAKAALETIKNRAPYILKYSRPTGLSKNDVACSLEVLHDIEEVLPELLKLLSKEDWSCDLFFATPFKHESVYYENSVVIYAGLYQFIIDRPSLRSAFIFALSNILYCGQYRVIKPENYEQSLTFFKRFIQRASLSEIYEVLGHLSVDLPVDEEYKMEKNQNRGFLRILCAALAKMCDEPYYADKLTYLFAKSPSADASADEPPLESVKGRFTYNSVFYTACEGRAIVKAEQLAAEPAASKGAK